MIGVSNSAPPLPVFVIVKVEPLSSSGLTLLSRVRQQIVDALGQPGDIEVPGVLDHGHEQAARRVHRDADVLDVVVGDVLALNGGIDLRVGL